MFKQDKDGQIWYQKGEREWIAVTEEQANQLHKNPDASFLGNLGASYLEGIASMATGIGALAGHEPSREIYDETTASLQARGIQHTGSNVTQFLPDVVMGGVAGMGRSMGARMAMTGGVEAGLGAARNPDNPVAGAAIQGSIGAAFGAIPMRTPGPRARRALDQQAMPNMNSIDELHGMDIPLTNAQKRALEGATGRTVTERMAVEQIEATIPGIGAGKKTIFATQGRQFARILSGGIEDNNVSTYALRYNAEAAYEKVVKMGEKVSVKIGKMEIDNLPPAEKTLFEQLQDTDRIRASDIIALRQSDDIITSEAGHRNIVNLMEDLRKVDDADLQKAIDQHEMIRQLERSAVKDENGLVDMTKTVYNLKDKGFVRPDSELGRIYNTMQKIKPPSNSVASWIYENKVKSGAAAAVSAYVAPEIADLFR